MKTFIKSFDLYLKYSHPVFTEKNKKRFNKSLFLEIIRPLISDFLKSENYTPEIIELINYTPENIIPLIVSIDTNLINHIESGANKKVKFYGLYKSYTELYNGTICIKSSLHLYNSIPVIKIDMITCMDFPYGGYLNTSYLKDCNTFSKNDFVSLNRFNSIRIKYKKYISKNEHIEEKVIVKPVVNPIIPTLKEVIAEAKEVLISKNSIKLSSVNYSYLYDVLHKLITDVDKHNLQYNNLPIETFTFSVCFDNGICHKLYINGKLNPVVIMYENDYKDKLEKFLDSINVVEIKKYINTIK